MTEQSPFAGKTGKDITIRVSPGYDRDIKCTSEKPMNYICMQGKAGSLGQYTMTHAEVTQHKDRI